MFDFYGGEVVIFCEPLTRGCLFSIQQNDVLMRALSQVKRCSREKVEELYLEYQAGTGPRLDSDQLCR